METSAPTESEIWSRIIRPEQGNLSQDGARDLLQFSISEPDRARASQLSAKANAGPLSASEAAELDHYLNVARALELIKAKARLTLKAAA